MMPLSDSVSMEHESSPTNDTHTESDTQSASSTVVYNHEPYDTFQHIVRSFAKHDLWPDGVAEDITVDRLSGGSFNRIIGLGYNGTRYILRIPRFDSAELCRDVAILEFLQQHTQLPVPRIEKYDETPDNKLGLPYMVQDRIDGVDLYSSFSDLDDEKRCQVARELGHVFHQMLATRTNVAGHFSYSKDCSHEPFHITPFHSTHPIAYCDRPATQTTLELLESSFQAQKAVHMNDSITVLSNLVDQLGAMASELGAGGWLTDIPNCIAHLDLAPRNILINPNAQGHIISSILDWDSAVSAPSFMACSPPFWLWAWEDYHEDEWIVKDTPSTPQGHKLKRLFEKAAGEKYMQFASKPKYRLARQLVQFAIDGVQSNEAFKEAKAMLQEWDAIKEEKKPTVLNYLDSLTKWVWHRIQLLASG
ncbi:hypothetical protein F4781DRAFT_407341 [Annulohypoxylon bovei var. microspora]|nr:hypothetical protein F4781DRAFT_407341 [Annulohypoxylon bovei var. microspora]